MNYFVIIEEIEEFNEVKFYSIKIAEEDDDEPYNEFEKFILKFQDYNDERIREEFETIIAIIEHIGNRSARIQYFRPENAAFALPPKARTKVSTIEIKADSKLRLYCVLINAHIVILCNGGWKTKNSAQECPNVATHFRLAEKLANYLNRNRDEFEIIGKQMLIGKNNGFYL